MGLDGWTEGFGAEGYDAGAALVGSEGPTPPPILRLVAGAATGFGLGATIGVTVALGAGDTIAGVGRVGRSVGVTGTLTFGSGNSINPVVAGGATRTRSGSFIRHWSNVNSLVSSFASNADSGRNFSKVASINPRMDAP